MPEAALNPSHVLFRLIRIPIYGADTKIIPIFQIRKAILKLEQT